MSIVTILLFFIYTYGLGFTVTRFLKNSENFLERNLMRIGIGLGVFIILGIFLNLLHVPLDWRIFLVLSLVFPLYDFFKSVKKKELTIPKFRLTKSNLNVIIVFALFIFLLSMYAGGAFKYPYLEDDDPWSYAESSKYIAVEKNLNDENEIFKFLDPYPPGYSLLMGVLHQTSRSLSWTLKFFNALLISLGIIFFYFFAKEFTKDKNKALFATFILAMLPCFFTHFIWAISLAIPLFLIVLYCLERIKYNKKWLYVTALNIGAISVIHPSMILKLWVMIGLYFLVKLLLEKKVAKYILFAGIFGGVISLMWWLTNLKSLFLIRASKYMPGVNGESVSSFYKLINYIQRAFSPSSGTATRAYNFNDFFIAEHQGMINVQIGFGIFVTILLFLAFIYLILKYKTLIKEKNSWILITLLWFGFTFLNVNSRTFNLPIGFYSFRSWLLLAIVVALLASLGLKFLFSFTKSKMAKSIILIIVVMGVIFTAGHQKYSVNTAMWPPGVGWTSMEEVQGYSWLKTLPIDTKVFMYLTNDGSVIGFDKYSCVWCEEVIDFKEKLLDQNLEELHFWLKSNDYEYFIISGLSYKYLGKKFGENRTKEKISSILEEISTSKSFQIAYQNNAIVIFRVL